MAAVHKTALGFRLRGDDLDPDVVSATLCCLPSSCGRKGEVQSIGRGRVRPSPVGFWHRQVVRRNPGDLDGQIAELLGGMTADIVAWRRLTDVYAADVFCGLFMREGNEGLGLRPATLLALGARNIALSLDIYALATPPARRPVPPRDGPPASA